MEMQRNEAMAQAVYMAQVEANKGECDCKVCQILRKGNDAMVSQFLGVPVPNPGTKLPKTTEKVKLGE